jgi:hypothetical protein
MEMEGPFLNKYKIIGLIEIGPLEYCDSNTHTHTHTHTHIEKERERERERERNMMESHSSPNFICLRIRMQEQTYGLPRSSVSVLQQGRPYTRETKELLTKQTKSIIKILRKYGFLAFW